MNCNLAGNELTRDELTTIAVDNGLATAQALVDLAGALHNDALIRTRLSSLTQNVRFSMWARGELLLDTSTKLRDRRCH